LHGDRCSYCGDRATTDDHFPPYATTLRGWILPACLECNGLAGTAHGRNFEARVRHVKTALRERYRSLLAAPSWSAHDLDELGSTLRSAVMQGEVERDRILARLGWSTSAYLANLDAIAAAELRLPVEPPQPIAEAEPVYIWPPPTKAPRPKRQRTIDEAWLERQRDRLAKRLQAGKLNPAGRR
jgi:hypothetical protein